jgi:hypothetical protein
MTTTLYTMIEGRPERAGTVDLTLADIVESSRAIGAQVVAFINCPFPEHDLIALWRGEVEGFGFDVLPGKDGPELKPRALKSTDPFTSP